MLKAKDIKHNRPEVEDECRDCHGSGNYDESYHGSPIWKTCANCKGTGKVVRAISNDDG